MVNEVVNENVDRDTEELVLELTRSIGNLVHATQRERGGSSVYLASGGTKFESQLAELRKFTDAMIDALLTTSGSNEMASIIDSSEYSRAIQMLARLAPIRNGVNALSISPSEAIEYLTDLNETMLVLSGTLIEQIPDTRRRGEMLGLLALLRAKELAGAERAILAQVFTEDTFKDGHNLWTVALITVQETLFRMAVGANDETFAADLARIHASDPALATSEMETLALVNGVGGFEVDPAEWFDQITAKIDLLKDLEDDLLERLESIDLGRAVDAVPEHDHTVSEAISAAVIAMGRLRIQVDQLRRGELSLRDFMRGHGQALLDAEQQFTMALETEKLTARATRDELTGVLNRSAVPALVKAAMRRCNRATETVAALMIDLDNFKVINDSLGNSIGDQLLRSVAERLRQAIGTNDALARVGGDEFVVIASPIGSDRDAEELAERIMAHASNPHRIDDRELTVHVSVGVSLASPGQGVDALMRHADLALLRAKRSGRGQAVLFDDELRREMESRHEMEMGLRDALSTGQIRANFQPIVDVSTGEVIAAEALARWDSKDGLLTAGQFCPIAADAGLLPAIDEQVLRSALRERPTFKGHKPKISINVSDLQLRHALFAEQLREDIIAGGVTPEDMWIEVTEHYALSNKYAIENLTRLREMGCTIALDDFGSGYSALSVLRTLPLDVVKLDGFFVTDIDREEATRETLRSVLGIIQALGLKAVAENVETQQQLEVLASLGCDMAQGFHIAMPSRTADEWSLPAMPAPVRHLRAA